MVSMLFPCQIEWEESVVLYVNILKIISKERLRRNNQRCKPDLHKAFVMK